MINEDPTIYTDALNAWGFDAQMDMVIEEMSELTKAILKYRRNPSPDTSDHIAEELSDVLIMLKQLEIAMINEDPNFNINHDKHTKFKLNRIRSMLPKLQ